MIQVDFRCHMKILTLLINVASSTILKGIPNEIFIGSLINEGFVTEFHFVFLYVLTVPLTQRQLMKSIFVSIGCGRLNMIMHYLVKYLFHQNHQSNPDAIGSQLHLLSMVFR